MLDKIYNIIEEMKEVNDSIYIMESEILDGNRPDPWAHCAVYDRLQEARSES